MALSVLQLRTGLDVALRGAAGVVLQNRYVITQWGYLYDRTKGKWRDSANDIETTFMLMEPHLIADPNTEAQKAKYGSHQQRGADSHAFRSLYQPPSLLLSPVSPVGPSCCGASTTAGRFTTTAGRFPATTPAFFAANYKTLQLETRVPPADPPLYRPREHSQLSSLLSQCQQWGAVAPKRGFEWVPLHSPGLMLRHIVDLALSSPETMGRQNERWATELINWSTLETVRLTVAYPLDETWGDGVTINGIALREAVLRADLLPTSILDITPAWGPLKVYREQWSQMAAWLRMNTGLIVAPLHLFEHVRAFEQPVEVVELIHRPQQARMVVVRLMNGRLISLPFAYFAHHAIALRYVPSV